jgi:hypothetical protein
MKRTLLRALPLVLAGTILFGGLTAYASDTLDALHNGSPPLMPTTAAQIAQPETATPNIPEPTPTATAPINAFEPLPSTEIVLPTVTSTPAPVAMPEPAPVVPALYPTDVTGIEENGTRWIVKTYALSSGENPDGITTDSFELDGWRYELTDITKKETAAADTRAHTETITVNTDTKDMDVIIRQLSPTLDYSSADGYAGTLSLDLATVTMESAGTKTSGYTVSATREYPQLSTNDTSLIPKTVTENGKTLTLQSVDWKSNNTEAVDYDQIAKSYTAIATYTATGSKTVVTGYITTAEYNGTLTKLVNGRTVYTAYFAGTELSPLTPEPEPTTETTPEHNKTTLPMAVIIGIILAVALLAGLAFLLLFKCNVRVFNLKDGKYAPIGKTRVTAANAVINLTPFTDKAATGGFILVVDRFAAKKLSGKAVTVNYGDKSFQHIVDGSGGEYQFEVDF